MTMDKGPGMDPWSKVRGKVLLDSSLLPKQTSGEEMSYWGFPLHISQFPLMTTHNELILSLSNKNMSRSFSN